MSLKAASVTTLQHDECSEATFPAEIRYQVYSPQDNRGRLGLQTAPSVVSVAGSLMRVDATTTAACTTQAGGAILRGN